MTSLPPPRSGPEVESLQTMLARLEGKVDAALARQGTTLAAHDDDIKDHEERLRVVEARSTVSWRQLWAVVGSAAAGFAALSPLLERLYSLHP